MGAAFEKIFYISSELLRMQEFWGFTNYVHQLATCTDKDCVIDGFLKKIREVIFNEELSFDQRRFFFRDICYSNLSVFNAMFQLHHRGKKNINRIEFLCENPADILQRQLARNEKLKKRIAEKYKIQKKIDSIVEDLFLDKH